LLFALGKVVTRALDATLIVAPAHHYIPGANLLVGSLVAAEPALSSIPVIVAGAAMNGVNMGDRLLVPGPRLDERILSVSRLVEHASPAQAKRLKASGALWDTSTFMARATDLWKMTARKLPTEAAIVASLWSGEMETLDSVATAFRHMPGIRLNGTLWPRPKELGVIPVRGSGWSAWNSPEQVMDSLRDPHDLERLLSRIYQQQQGIDRAQLRKQFRAEARQRDVPPSCMVHERQSIMQAERT
jgi:mannose-1-phosphate guanylyltransferase